MRGLGAIQATERECAAFLGVALHAWQAFKASNPIVEQTLQAGSGNAKVSLRRAQYDLALGERGPVDARGNAPYTRLPDKTMLIWLGKQELGQRDQTALTGKDGGPVQHVWDYSNLTDEELNALRAILVKTGAPVDEPPPDLEPRPGNRKTAH